MGILNKVFFNIGYASASNPFTCCFLAFMITVIFSLGFLNFSLTVIKSFVFFKPFSFRMILNCFGSLPILDQI